MIAMKQRLAKTLSTTLLKSLHYYIKSCRKVKMSSISRSSKVKSKARTGGRDGSCVNCWLMFMVTVHPCMLNIDWCGQKMGYGTVFLTFMTVGVVEGGAIYEVVRTQANTTRRELKHPEHA